MTTTADLLNNPDVQQGLADLLASYDEHRAEQIRAERAMLDRLVEGEGRRQRKRL